MTLTVCESLQARRSALMFIAYPNAKAQDQDEIGKAIRRITSELDGLTKLSVVRPDQTGDEK